MIRLERVTKRYGEVTAVHELDLVIPEGKLVVLIGPSGCGKTTTLKMMNRLIEPSSGRILVNGQDTLSLDPQRLRRGIGYVIQSIGLFPHMTVAENIGVVPNLLGWSRAKRRARADELLELIGLEPQRYRGAYPRELSGGQAQRVGVARALAVDPPILLMDEPFGAVDPLTRERLQEEFLRLQERLRKTIVMVTHDIDEAIRLGDLVCLMNAGRIEQFATPEELLSQPRTPFVRQFVGADSTLKRLSRVQVADLMTAAEALELSAPLEQVAAALETQPLVFITQGGRFVGYVLRGGLGDTLEASLMKPSEGLLLRPKESVKDALSRLLAQGLTLLPVVVEGQLVGALGLETILAATAPERT